MRLGRISTVLAASGTAVVVSAGPALAHDCIHTKKNPASGGVVGTYYVADDTFVPSRQKGNAGFMAITFPDGHTVVTFSHSGPGGTVPGAQDCDGKGLDSFMACMALG